jgi:hypothetical protein
MPIDPRLENTALLTLAAYRLQQRRLTPQPPDWRNTEGLAALLAAAKHLPRCAPWELPDLAACTGMERLLAEARLKGADHGA